MHEEHLTARESAVKAMREVSGPVVAIVLVLCAVFVPIAFLGGLTGELYRQFAVTISIAVVISGIVALTLTPALCVLILSASTGTRGASSKPFNAGSSARRSLRCRGWIHGCGAPHRRCAVLVMSRDGMDVAAAPGSLVPDEDQLLHRRGDPSDGASCSAPTGRQRSHLDIKSNPYNEDVVAFTASITLAALLATTRQTNSSRKSTATGRAVQRWSGSFRRRAILGSDCSRSTRHRSSASAGRRFALYLQTAARAAKRCRK